MFEETFVFMVESSAHPPEQTTKFKTRAHIQCAIMFCNLLL